MPISFRRLETWKDLFINNQNQEYLTDSSFPFVIIGNKIDLIESRLVTIKEVKEWCYEKNLPFEHFETSVKKEINIEAAFKKLAELALKRNREVAQQISLQDNDMPVNLYSNETLNSPELTLNINYYDNDYFKNYKYCGC
jgi:GTPase SAR1 family protein